VNLTPSLHLGFADSPVTARLRAAPGCEDALRRLTVKFRTGQQRAHGTSDIEVDDLLAGLELLAEWPHAESVVWDPALASLATDTVADAQRAAARLSGAAGVDDIAPEDLPRLLGAAWVAPLTPFQRRDIAKLLSLRHGANFSVPGAGKTRASLAIFQALRQTEHVERLLVVGPKSAYESWLSENAACFGEPLAMHVLGEIPEPTADAIIVNYERIDRSANALARWISDRPTLLVLDEAHRMKRGAGGVYGSACMALGARAHRRLILTGTPAPNGAKDLENLLAFVWPGHGRQSVARAVGGGDLAQASRALQPLFTRTTKHELDLPPVDMALRWVELPPLHREIYDALIGHFSVRAAASRDDFHALGKIIIYLLIAATSPALLAVGTTRYDPLAYQVPPLPVPDGAPLAELMRDLPSYEMSPKYQEALAIVAANAAQGRKTVVWSTFVRSLATLERILKEFGPATVHGGTEDRQEEIERFRGDPDCMVLLSNPATLGEGISLHHDCHDSVYVDRDFAAGRFLQSLDRIHRLGLAPGTETRVTILGAAGTIDEVVAQRLGDKLQFMGRILDDPEVRQLADLDEEPSVGGGLDTGDLQALMGYLRGRAP
jgi:SNF2 family DNA or RNA helicase